MSCPHNKWFTIITDRWLFRILIAEIQIFIQIQTPFSKKNILPMQPAFSQRLWDLKWAGMANPNHIFFKPLNWKFSHQHYLDMTICCWARTGWCSGTCGEWDWGRLRWVGFWFDPWTLSTLASVSYCCCCMWDRGYFMWGNVVAVAVEHHGHSLPQTMELHPRRLDLFDQV